MDDECEYVQGYITTRKEMMGNTDICETRDPYSYVSSLVPFDFGKIDTRLSNQSDISVLYNFIT